MSKATKCDRCGGFYEQGGKNVRQGWGSMSDEYDLCPDCAESFDAWLERRQMADASEHVTNDGEMLHDTREKLEAAAQTAAGYIYGRGFTNGLADAWNDDEVDAAANQIIQLLDRQAAITERETLHSHPMCAGSDACPALNRPNGESADRETPDTAENGATKGEIHNFDDSRERLEADVREFAQVYYADNLLVYDKVIKLLNRQAAITERECMERSTSERIGFDCAECAEGLGRELEARCYHLKARIAELEREAATLKEHRAGNMERLHELTDECAELRKYRDEWKGLAEKYRADSIAAQAECEKYRAKLGDVLDAIHEAERAAR